MLIISAICLLFAASSLESVAADSDPILCPQNFISVNNKKCIQIVPQLTNYVNASAQCALSNARLVSIPNAIDNNAIANLISILDKPVWLGLKCNESQNAYACLWDDNSGWPQYNNFYNGYPIVEAGNCVYMVSTGALRGRWISGACVTESFYYICEAAPLDPSTDFCAYSDNGFCYFPFFQSLSEPDAQAMCQQDCADLVSIHSERENNYLLNLLLPSINNSSSLSYVRIGAELLSNGSFHWNDGTAWDYDHFGFANPNLGSCASMSLKNDVVGTGQWINSHCETTLPFICKRKSDVQCGSPVTPTPMPDKCNGTQFLSNSGNLFSPNWPGSYYGVQAPCSFILSTPIGTYTQIQFPLFYLDNYSTISLYNNIEDSKPFTVLSNYQHSWGWYSSSSNSMKVVFQPCTSNCGQYSDPLRWEATFQWQNASATTPNPWGK